ncbi:MAG: hypothetical protein ACXABY_13145 [Candidatus Thorarchaeota archaeon]|jgi:hypothetical protein
MKTLSEIRADLRPAREILWQAYTDALRYANSLRKQDREGDAARVDQHAENILVTIHKLSVI